jgi:hypothetical protein
MPILNLLLPVLNSPLGRWLAGGAVAVLLALGAYTYVGHLNHTIDMLRVQNADLKQATIILNRNADALADELAAAKARAAYYQSIKEAINESPSGSVPADIRTALERLRKR